MLLKQSLAASRPEAETQQLWLWPPTPLEPGVRPRALDPRRAREANVESVGLMEPVLSGETGVLKWKVLEMVRGSPRSVGGGHMPRLVLPKQTFRSPVARRG